MKLNLGCGPHHLPDFENLNPPDWSYEDGLAYYDETVDGISISHSLMMIEIADWPAVFAEIARVLEPGGIVRVTEDDTENPASERFGGWQDAVTLTSPKLLRKHLRAAGLVVTNQTAVTSGYRDLSLCQAWHGTEPKVFFIEGRKP